MALSSRPTPGMRELVRLLRRAVADEDGCGLPAISHRLPIATPDGRAARIFTVDLTPDQRGTFLVACRELPNILMFVEGEEEALASAEQTIKEVLSDRHVAPDLPL